MTDNQWTETDANVVCRLMGFSNGGIPGDKYYTIWYNKTDYGWILHGFHCTGDESRIDDCLDSNWTIGSCSYPAGVICNTAKGNIVRIFSL